MKTICLKFSPLLTLACGLVWCTAGYAQTFHLVKDGVARSVIVVAPDAPEGVHQAAEELRWHVQRATTVNLPILTPAEAATLDASTALVLVGPSTLTESLGVAGDDLPIEAYRIKTVGRHLVFLGHDYAQPVTSRSALDTSPATMWAVDDFLDRQLGVRWLWPGELGTYVPERDTIAMPVLDVTRRPELLTRHLRVYLYRRNTPGLPQLLSDEQYLQLWHEANQWKSRHQMGTRSPYTFGHAFGHWWEKYHAEHSDYFATPPKGYEQPYPNANRVKLCVSNEAIDDAIIAEWQAAGAPDNWNVSPNDGSGFCTCDRCRALDVPKDQDPIDIWRARGKLTVRYVTFWNRLIRKMRAINPDVTISSYAYSAYRDAPPPSLPLEPGIVLQVVDSYTAPDNWSKWYAAGAKLMLRPNWWHTGAGAPHLPLHAMGEYFDFARSHAMIGFDFDSITGHWATQGPNYYLIARMGARPDLSVDDILAEYASAFEEAAPAIADYLRYWENFTQWAAYSIPAGGNAVQNPQGPYETLVRKHKLSSSSLVGSWQVMPDLYTDEVIDDAAAILDRALALLPTDRDQARARVRFLQDGLRHLRLTRDVLTLGYGRNRPESATAKDFAHLAQQLQDLRRELTPSHAVWGEFVNQTEARRGIPTAPGRIPWTDTDGM